MLRTKIDEIASTRGALHVAAAYYDYETRTSWSYDGDRWFHAASTIKVAILVALFDAVAAGRFALHHRLHVRNRFLGAVHDDPFRVEVSRDGNDVVHRAVGKTMRLRELAFHMIVTSSNLATNLLLDLVGVEAVHETVARLGVKGVDLRRHVEDEHAFEAGLNNRVTAHGLVQLFRRIFEADGITEAHAGAMREILEQQAFRSGIPAGIPEAVRAEARFAHKTGEISTIAHDAGLVFLPGREPYATAILTAWPPGAEDRRAAVADVSRVLYEHLTDDA